MDSKALCDFLSDKALKAGRGHKQQYLRTQHKRLTNVSSERMKNKLLTFLPCQHKQTDYGRPNKPLLKLVSQLRYNSKKKSNQLTINWNKLIFQMSVTSQNLENINNDIYNTRYVYFFSDRIVYIWSILERLCFDKSFTFHQVTTPL